PGDADRHGDVHRRDLDRLRLRARILRGRVRVGRRLRLIHVAAVGVPARRIAGAAAALATGGCVTGRGIAAVARLTLLVRLPRAVPVERRGVTGAVVVRLLDVTR